MGIQWMNHTGFVVKNMEKSLAFYCGLLGFVEERNWIREGDYISGITGLKGERLHVVYLGIGDMRHSVELLQYLDTPGSKISPTERNDIGATHLGMIVDDLDSIYKDLLDKGVNFATPPSDFPNAKYPWAKKGCHCQDPDGNWIEFLERMPPPSEAEVS